jgi:hypothetical protein
LIILLYETIQYAVICLSTRYFTQAVFKKVKALGLAGSYRRDEAMYTFMRQLMNMPFLPSLAIPPAFESLKARANMVALDKLCRYYEKQWMLNTVFTIPRWCVNGHSVGTNNDVEGK